jgi:type IV pilus assembly protein PilC
MAVFKSGSATAPTSTLPKPGPTKAAPPPVPRGAPLLRPPERSVGDNRPGAREHIAGARTIRSRELPAFSRQLSAMLLAGMPLIQCLDALEDQTSDKNFKILVAGLRNYLQSGASFSEALGHYPTVFDNLYINMIRAGESGGQLGETAARLADFLEDSAKLARKVKSAMSYPVIVMCIALGIAVAMIVFIVPVFSEMFATFGKALPGPTQFLVNLSEVLRSKYGLIVLVIFIIAIVLIRKWKKTPTGALLFAGLMLKMPVIGELNRKVATSRFARTFAQLLQSGVPILRAMEIVAGATGNQVFEQVVMEARSTVEKGEPLSSALIRQPCFPKLLVHMMAAGEKTGKIDEMMQNIANFYDDEIETMLEGLTALIEPLLMVFLGVVIGGIVIAMFLPIFKMGEVVGAGR